MWSCLDLLPDWVCIETVAGEERLVMSEQVKCFSFLSLGVYPSPSPPIIFYFSYIFLAKINNLVNCRESSV